MARFLPVRVHYKRKIVVQRSRIQLAWRCRLLILAITNALYLFPQTFPNTNSCFRLPILSSLFNSCKMTAFRPSSFKILLFGRSSWFAQSSKLTRKRHEIDRTLCEQKRTRPNQFHKLKLKAPRTKNKEISLTRFLIYKELCHH